MPIDFRPAQASDAHDIARFFQLTSEGMADYIWSKLAAPGEALLSVGASRYAREQGDFSYKNCLMATFEGRVIGMMHSYALREALTGLSRQTRSSRLMPTWKYPTPCTYPAWPWMRPGAARGWACSFFATPSSVLRTLAWLGYA